MRRSGVLLLLVAFFASSAGALVVGPEVPAAPPVYGPAQDINLGPAVASDGSDYLVVWRGGESDFDLEAAIVSSSGVLKTQPRRNLSDDDPTWLNAAWNGSSYLVAWSSNVKGGIVTAHLDRDASLLDQPRTLISGATMGAHALAWNGSNDLLVYADGPTKTAAVLLSPNGEIVRNIAIPFPPHTSVPEVVAVGSTFYVVGAMLNGTVGAFRIGGDGTVADAQPAVVGTIRSGGPFDVATNGTTIVLVISLASGVQSIAIDPATLQGASRGSIAGGRSDLLSIASNGSTFVVSWSFYAPLQTADLDALGSPANPTAAGCCGPTTAGVAVASNGSTFFGAWQDATAERGEIVGSLFPTLGAPAGGTLISTTAIRQSRPAMSGSLLAWREPTTNGGTEVRAVRTGPNGTIGDSVVLSQSYRQDDLAVTFDGSVYFVAWTDTPAAGDDPRVMLRRLRSDASPLDAAPVTLAAPPSSQPSLASDGTHAFAVWSSRGAILGVAVPDIGLVFDPPVTIVPQFSSTPHVAWNGSEYLVLWLYGNGCVVPCPTPTAQVRAARLSAAGNLLDPASILVANVDPPSGIVNLYADALASNGRDFLAGYVSLDQGPGLFEAYRRIHVRHIGADGTLGPELMIAQTPWDQVPNVALARLHDGYVAAFQNGVNELHLAHVDGPVTGDVVFGTVEGAELALADDVPLVAYTRFARETAYGGVRRLFTRMFRSEPRQRLVRR